MKKVISAAMTFWPLLFSLPSLAAPTDNQPLIVFAAASLTNALQEVGDAFTKAYSIPVKFSFAASSALARQIESGASADVFFSADIEWMDYLPLAAVLGTNRLATGDPDSVPVGRYAREALTKLGVWDDIEKRLVRADSVRSALAFVDRGEAALGIVYATDAEIDKKVRVVDVFPDNTHLPIVYPIALTTAAKPDALKFVDYVRSTVGDAIFRKYGFVPLR